uniref:Uncharacterized protein n=1 Tax=viral metagenome TaxID=1070528 RepID=A0A6H2A4R4_9ZZZZ
MKKTINFKTVSPMFEMERDGKKYFTIRKIDYKDSRFRALGQWIKEWDWLIKITEPSTDETFTRHIFNVSRIHVFDARNTTCKYRTLYDWLIIEWDFRKGK